MSFLQSTHAPCETDLGTDRALPSESVGDRSVGQVTRSCYSTVSVGQSHCRLLDFRRREGADVGLHVGVTQHLVELHKHNA